MHDDDLPADPTTLVVEESAKKPMKSTPATKMLATAGLPYVLHTVIPELAKTGSGGEHMSACEKASYLGIDSRRLFRTVIVSTGPGLVSATLPACSELDLQSLAAAVGAHSATMADSSTSRRASGCEAPYTSPLGLTADLPTIIDVSAMAYPSIMIGSGVAGLILEIMPVHLLNVLRARTAPIATP